MSCPSAWGCILQLGCERGAACVQNLKSICFKSLWFETSVSWKTETGAVYWSGMWPWPGADSQHRQLSLHAI